MQRAADGGGHRQRVQPDPGVPLHQSPPPRIGVPGPDVPRAPLAVDHGHDAGVGERGDHELGQPAERGLAVEGTGQLRGDGGEQGGPPGRPPGGLFGPHAVADIQEVDGEATGLGPGAHLEPGVGGRTRIGSLEADRLAGAHRRAERLVEDAADRLRIDLGHRPAEEVRAWPAHQPLRLGIDVAEPPLGVEQAEAGRHRVEHADQVDAVGRRARAGPAVTRGRQRAAFGAENVHGVPHACGVDGPPGEAGHVDCGQPHPACQEGGAPLLARAVA
jgi:hypothetical protein